MDKLNIIAIINFLKKRIYFIDGLIVLLIVTFAAYFLFINYFAVHVLSVIKGLNLEINKLYLDIIYLLGLVFIVILTIYFWKGLRKPYHFKENELGIIFAPDFSEELKKDVERICVHLHQEIKSHEINCNFSIKLLPPNILINSSEQAIKLLNGCNGITAIWGTIEKQKSKDGNRTGFSQIFISYVHRPAEININRYLSIANSFINKKLTIDERNVIVDSSVLARDLGLIVRNVIGVTLLINQNFNEAIKVFMPLYIDLKAIGINNKSVIIKKFKLSVQIDLANALTKSTSKDYYQYYIDENIFDIPKEICNTWISNVKQAITLDPQNSFYYRALGIYTFILGEKGEAIKALEKAVHVAPSADASPYLSLAFLYNFYGNYDSSSHFYKRGLSKKTSYNEELINECIGFIKQCIKKYPEKKQLKLAHSLLEIHRGSEENGYNALEEFLNDLPKEDFLQKFVEEAKDIFEKRKKHI
ncbi:tetratricopeptide repeat protein [Candidatus Latescibacterota bacterium]